MKHVLTSKTDGRLRPKSRRPANVAKGICVYTIEQLIGLRRANDLDFVLFGTFRDTFRIQARQTLRLVFESAARMLACQHLVASVLLHFLAILSFADVFKGFYLASTHVALHLSVAETALSCLFVLLELLACLSNVIRLSIAFTTEVLRALTTPDPVLTHMQSCFMRDRLSLVVFLSKVDLTFLNFHECAAGTLPQVGVHFDERP